MVAWQNYIKNKECRTLIVGRLDATRRQQIKKNHHYLKTIAEVLLLCSQLELALRGDDESAKSINRGNILVASHNEIIRDKLTSGPTNATYTSPDIQNTLLNIIGRMVQNIICSKIQESRMFSVFVDECKDRAIKEQLTIVLRCVDLKDSAIHEYFLLLLKLSALMLKVSQDTFWIH